MHTGGPKILSDHQAWIMGHLVHIFWGICFPWVMSWMLQFWQIMESLAYTEHYCLFIWLSVCLSPVHALSLSIYLSIDPSSYISIYSFFVYLCMYVSIYISIYLSIYLQGVHKYCDFSIKCHFSELCQFCCSANVLPV